VQDVDLVVEHRFEDVADLDAEGRCVRSSLRR
jgi:hypothetical protein